MQMAGWKGVKRYIDQILQYSHQVKCSFFKGSESFKFYVFTTFCPLQESELSQFLLALLRYE